LSKPKAAQFGQSQGAGQKSIRGPPWVGRSEAKKVTGPNICFDIFCCVFGLPSLRNTQKRDKKQIKKKMVLDFLVDFFVKTFRSVFELPSLRNTQKREKIVGKLTWKFCRFFVKKVFDMDF
jgi:hypothetical protein